MTQVSRKCLVARPIVELIQETKAKLKLIEGDRVAYYEKSFLTLQNNKDKISTLRKEVHDLHLLYWDKVNKNESIICQAFQNRPVEKAAFLGKTSDVAVEEFDFRVSVAMKRYNHARFVTSMKEKKLHQLRIELADAQVEVACDMAEIARKTPHYQKVRDLENRVDKLELKGNESEFIQKTYDAIFRRLYEEHVRCNSTLDELELDIVRCRGENAELRQTNKEALVLRDATQRDLQAHEEFELADRKRREIEETRIRRVMEEERKKWNERVERTKVRVGSEFDEVYAEESSIDLTSATRTQEVQAVSMSAQMLEYNMEKLREKMGISDMKSAVQKLESQIAVKANLVELINNTETNIQKLKEDCEAKRKHLAYVKNTYETATSELTDNIFDRNRKISKSTKQNYSTTEKFENVSIFFAECKAGLESLMEKLTQVKLPEKAGSGKPNTPEEYMTEVFNIIKKKSEVLLEELSGHDIELFKKKMDFEQKIVLLQRNEFKDQVNQKLPVHNDRITGVGNTNSDEEALDSGPDDPSFKNRILVKQDSSQFIEMRLRKRQRKRKHRK